MGIQTTRASTVARPFMRLLPQKLTVQVPGNDAEAEVRSADAVFRCLIVVCEKSPMLRRRMLRLGRPGLVVYVKRTGDTSA